MRVIRGSECRDSTSLGDQGPRYRRVIRNEIIWYRVEQDGSQGNVGDLVWV